MADKTAAGPRSGKRQRTRDRIALAGVALFREQGFEGTTMEQIAAAADVVRGTLYNHFPVKEAIVVHWLHGQLAEALGPLMEEAMTRPTFLARVATLLDASAGWWEQHRSFAAPYVRHRFQEVREDQGEEPTSEIVPAYEALIHLGQEAGELSTAMPAGRLAAYLHFLSLCALLDWVANPKISLPLRYTDALEFFMEGARARKGRPR
ncbi:TetR/AcrR family transcriptional regulator [Luteimonas sp. RD2P54]|uniref:TetR/AcrR family transcriptional regulator n=1 Tax=Luteimonas endophytica TaxID=3042023 RepID=A0ABT6JA48_9GAMM|nr:TetR/AcrR family transcriptional regulator [Luteimonas endophytica]MDH5823063.1 TetR/AcrR family transcriptional regulator [Luteimonas endophytica]